MRKRGVHGYRLVFVGVGASVVLGSATGFLCVRADIGKAARAASWMIGSLDARDRADVRVAALGLVVLVPVVPVYGRRLRLRVVRNPCRRRAERRPARTCRLPALAALAAHRSLPSSNIARQAPLRRNRVTVRTLAPVARRPAGHRGRRPFRPAPPV
ncbi:iron chelate uptake ABC transporter family permease subunit [Streptomyces tendae]|uniref:iron chelate uptake ABC transporter family permease subunit n=1 Tax=Streptomyces tendae TaxID=1932 RepID=UPI0037208411